MPCGTGTDSSSRKPGSQARFLFAWHRSSYAAIKGDQVEQEVGADANDPAILGLAQGAQVHNHAAI